VTDVAAAVAERLAGRSVACAESCTAGRVSAAFAAVGGASEWFRGGIVAYQDTVKRELLGVRARSVFTAEAAAEMAWGVASLLEADIAVATTGVLGDEPEDGTPPGTVYIATLVNGSAEVTERHFDGDAEEQCAEAVDAALSVLEARLAAKNRQEAARTTKSPSRSSTS
jgi:nicotinamide-nucleotide amidase